MKIIVTGNEIKELGGKKLVEFVLEVLRLMFYFGMPGYNKGNFVVEEYDSKIWVRCCSHTMKECEQDITKVLERMNIKAEFHMDSEKRNMLIVKVLMS